MKSKGTGTVVGWREWVDLPEWGIARVKAKIDTGARTSALHVENIERSGDHEVQFHIGWIGPRKLKHVVEITAPIARVGRVRSSTGQVQERFVIETALVLGPISHKVELSLVNRREMLCPMLVGRRALPSGTVVDPHRRYIHKKLQPGGQPVKKGSSKSKGQHS